MLRSHVGDKIYPQSRKKFYTAGKHTNDANWIFSTSEEVFFDEYDGQQLREIFKRTDSRIDGIITNIPEDLVRTEELCYDGKRKVYYERMLSQKPYFENPISIRTNDKSLKPVVPAKFVVNLNLLYPRFELIMQSYGRGDGITDMWCYGKVSYCGTCETDECLLTRFLVRSLHMHYFFATGSHGYRHTTA